MKSCSEGSREPTRRSTGLRYIQSELRLAIEVGDRIVCHSYQLPPEPSWSEFEAFLQQKLDFMPAFSTKYRDEDGDEVCLESQEEFLEALKVYYKIGSVLMLHVFPVQNDFPSIGAGDFSLVDADGFPTQATAAEPEQKISNTSSELNAAAAEVSKSTPVAPPLPDVTTPSSINLLSLNISPEAPDEDAVESTTSSGNDRESNMKGGCRPKEPSTPPPEWFTSYMDKFKGDITSEITKKVVHRMQKMMVNGGIVPTRHKMNKADEGATQPDSTTKTDPKTAPPTKFPIHTGIFCDHCGDAVVGIRYKCGNCIKFDLCEKCEGLKDVHERYHVFVKMRRPGSTAGMRKKSGKMAPLFKHILYDAETDKVSELRTEREKKLLKRLEKQAQKLDRYREKYRQRHAEREARYGAGWDSGVATTNGHRTLYNHHHHHHGHHGHNSSSQQQPTVRVHHATDDRSREAPVPKVREDAVVAASAPSAAMSAVAAVVSQPNYNPFAIDMMDAKFLHDETIPDGTVVAAGTKFTKTWHMLNAGTKPWTAETVLKCLWGSLGLQPGASEVPVPFLEPGEDGAISVDFTAPVAPGQYDSHWRLYHQGQRFGHRIWCSVIVAAADGSVTRKQPLAVPPPASQKRTLSSGSDHSGSARSSSSSQDVSADSLETVPTESKTSSRIQIQEPENGEKEQVREILRTHAYSAPLPPMDGKAWNYVVSGSTHSLKPQFTSATATPNNTPLDLSPPKSPEPLDTDQEEALCTDSGLAAEKDEDEKDMSFLSEDSDFGGSLVSLSSTDSDLGYVVVPLPPCFNFTVPATAACPIPDEGASLSEPLSSPGRDENSSVTTATDTDEESSALDGPQDHSNRTRDSIDGDRNCTDSEDEHSHHTLRGDDEVENRRASAVNSIETAPPQLAVEADSGEDLSPSAPICPSCDEATCADCDVEVPRAAPAPKPTEFVEMNSCAIPRSAPIVMPTEQIPYHDRMVPILPEPIMNAAACVFNSARGIFTTLTDPQKRLAVSTINGTRTVQVQEVPAEETAVTQIPQAAQRLSVSVMNGTRTVQADVTAETAAVETAARVAAAIRIPESTVRVMMPEEPSMARLMEMGFCDRTLNQTLLRKHGNNLDLVIGELLQLLDNDWHSNRH